jgi:prophage regulatory protein
MAQQFLRIPDVTRKTGLSRATIYLRMSQGRFPKPIPLGSSHAVAWLDADIEQWITEQVQAARGDSAGAKLVQTA